jgi:hypothetical protein
MAIHETKSPRPTDVNSAAVSATVKATETVKAKVLVVELVVVGLARKQKAEGRRQKVGVQ